ncbi:MAG TPA: pyrroloquinoline quinone-dependent dehydrogenase [Gemmatimonadales bacterium]|nr:pyrroloquinoline quinone-dependent dehydrogenase [Gemmatimonadales bacterium]
MRTSIRLLPLAALALVVGGGAAQAQREARPATSPRDGRPAAGEWAAYGRDPLGSRWSPLAQLTRENVGRLAVAWHVHTGELLPAHAARHRTSFESTPIVVDGTLYVSTPTGRVLALEPETGRTRWTFDPRMDRTVRFGDFTNRGVSTWTDPAARPGSPCARRIYLTPIDGRLIALDAATGTPCRGFGTAGTVDLRRGLRNRPYETAEYEVTSPPAVVNGILVVGSAVADNGRAEAASGEVRGYDARTGALRWTWDPVPQRPDDPAYATWEGPRAHHTGAANAWSVIAADPQRDLVVVPTSSPSPDYYGGERLGSNRYASSVVALRASTGALVWTFQTVHHDLWDYDNAAPPALVTVRRAGRDVPAVLQATKTGMLYVLDRETGEPLFPVEERPVPASTVPGERAWPTQPFSSLPALSPHRLDPDSIFGLNDADRAACRATLSRLRNEGIFTPPSLEGTVALPSNVGGAHWGGVAYDLERRIVVVPVNRIAAVVQLIRAEGADGDALRSEGERLGYETTRMRGTPYIMRRRIFRAPSGVPCTPPPFGTLVALSLDTGKKLWEVPLGSIEGIVRGADADSAALASWGSPSLGGPIATAGGLVFIAATLDRHLRAFDIETGRELWRAPLPAGGKATPMTFEGRDGRQYLVIAAGGDGEIFGRGDDLIAYALPQAAMRRRPAPEGSR